MGEGVADLVAAGSGLERGGWRGGQVGGGWGKLQQAYPWCSLEGVETEACSKPSFQDGAPRFPVCVELAARCGIVDPLSVEWGCRTVYGEPWGVYSADRKLASERRALARAIVLMVACHLCTLFRSRWRAREACLVAEWSVPTSAEAVGSCFVFGLPVFATGTQAGAWRRR